MIYVIHSWTGRSFLADPAICQALPMLTSFFFRFATFTISCSFFLLLITYFFFLSGHRWLEFIYSKIQSKHSPALLTHPVLKSLYC